MSSLSGSSSPTSTSSHKSHLRAGVHIDTPAEARRFIDNHDVFIFDCDGCLYDGNITFDGVGSLLKRLYDEGKDVWCLTNNSSKTRQQYVDKITEMYPEVKGLFKEDKALCSAYLTGLRLKQLGITRVYAIGSQNMVRELESQGITVVGGGEADSGKAMDAESLRDITVDPSIQAVISGFDVQINYYKLAYASLCLQLIPGCKFIATNPDAQIPVAKGALMAPGNLCIVRALATASGRQPDCFIAKPEPFAMQAAIRKAHPDTPASRMVMVGDRIDTDIYFGLNSGMESLLVCSGVTSEERAIAASSHQKDAKEACVWDYWCQDLSTIEHLLEQQN